jgi:hypothetical protein
MGIKICAGFTIVAMEYLILIFSISKHFCKAGKRDANHGEGNPCKTI